MGKKTKAESGGKQEEVLSIETFESLLLDRIISEYIQVTLVPSGKIESGPEITSEGYESLHLTASCHFDTGCPQNFGEFLVLATESGHPMKPSIAFVWWCRSRLRYSCSTIVTTFTRFMVPYMKKRRMEELTYLAGRTIRMDDLEIFSLLFKPRKSHALVLNTLLGSRTEIVEAVLPGSSLCSHNMLRCRKTGIIIDITLGQFLGTMKPYIFQDEDQYFSHVPGEIARFYKTTESDINSQVTRDNAPFREVTSPDSKPGNFTKRVFRSCQTNKEFCWNCKGISSVGSALKTCTKCKKATYCCRECQILHWKSHKGVCGQE